MNTAIDVKLRSVPEAAGQARRAVDGLSGRFRPGLIDEIHLLVSELVTNSYRHAGAGPEGWIGLRIETRANRVRVEVCDAGAGFEPTTLLPMGGQESG
jgi:anti-sigma regulatory factor (Ser/Thr protein kinase)